MKFKNDDEENFSIRVEKSRKLTEEYNKWVEEVEKPALARILNIDRQQLSTNFVHVGDWVNITDIDMYEKLARETALDEIKNSLNYFTLGLVGEAGEIANKVKKVIRDNDGEITEEQKLKIAAELGDVFWYLVGLCRIMGVKPSTVLAGNINKLQDRKKRGTIGGSGDQR